MVTGALVLIVVVVVCLFVDRGIAAGPKGSWGK